MIFMQRHRMKDYVKRRAEKSSVAFTMSFPLLTSILKLPKDRKDILCDVPQLQVNRFSFQTV